uniref:Intersectin-2-like n=1 Tax=Gouania willdenowi TaxID=441366 RepID=A0A8C5HIV3_GOUWI
MPTVCCFPGGVNVWSITPEERGKHDKQFDTLAPILGYVSGEQARKFFLQSGLPASVLADIWNLADMDGDGKMDRLEFSIAMKLIKLKLQGRNLPSALPIIMKQLPASNSGSSFPSSARFGMGSMPNLSVNLPSMSTMSTMPILTPIQANNTMRPMQPLLPTPMSLSLIHTFGNSGLCNGSISLLAPPLLSNNAGRSNSSSTTSLASNSPKTGTNDWAVPQASRLKYRQQFNTLDKLMSGYLSGPQVRNALMASNLTQTQLATIWSLADVNKDGQLLADEFILAMHLVDMAKTGHPLPLTLPQDLVPPSLRGGSKPSELVNGTSPSVTPSLIDIMETEDKLKENFARGSAELEKRRLTLEQEQRKEREKRAREEKEAHERREREAREQENRRRLEEERWLERQREMERQRNEERLRELERKEAAKLEMERQRREEWECGRREELSRKREGEQEEIFQLRARKRSLELELEAVGNKHKQISDCLRDAQSKRRIQKAEVDLINQKRDARIEYSFFGFFLLQNSDLKFYYILSLHQELREKKVKQQAVLDDLYRVKEEKLKELQRRREEENERRKREKEAALRRAEEAEQKRMREVEEERKQKEMEEEKTRKEEQERKPQMALNLTTYKALYSFVARNADELSIDADCLIKVDEDTVGEPGWLCGSYRGNRGWFPQIYAEKCTAASAIENAPTSHGVRSCLSIATLSDTPEVSTVHCYSFLFCAASSSLTLLARAISSWSASTEAHLKLFSCGDLISVLQQRDDWWLGQINGTQGWFPKSYVTLETSYVALYTYESPEVGDLTFVEGDVVIVTEKEGEWWRGCIGDQTGVFPSNYVRPVEPEASRLGTLAKKPEIAQAVTTAKSPMMHQLGLSPGQLIVVLAKNSTGWWLGELQARGKRRQRGWFHSSHVKLLGPSSCKSSPSPLPVCQVIAMYGYAAANKDELSFSKGQLINILDKTNSDWWKGEAGGVIGLLPTNYVKMTTESDPSQQWCADLMALDTMSPQERKRQGYIHELIQTEETYVEDLELVLEVFYRPMSESGRLTDTEMAVIFVNWRELILCNTKLLKALRVRKKTGGENMPVQLIGDLLASELAHMQPYIRFCSCQLNAAALLQNKTYNTPDFKDFLKKIATNYRCKGMPLSSFLLKPMQRITRYPLLIKNILENTPDGHADRFSLQEALDRAEELCSQVNEGVREKENSDRLEWIQSHVQCEGPIEHLVFNSLTNCLGPRKLLHSGRLSKTKSSRELWGFLFNDFLLLTHSTKPFSSEKLFSFQTSGQLKMYKAPLFLNEVLVKMPPDPSSDEPLFHVSHIDRVYTLKTETLNERTAWVQKIKAASEHFIETEKKKREKAYQARSLKTSGIGRLLVTVIEAQELKACKPNGKSNPYCELTMGAQCYTSRPISDTLSPKWNFNCQFFVNDLYQDVLCITVFEKDQFSPDDFLGRTEVPVATIKKELETKRAANRRLLLHEVPTGEVWVKLDLQLYEPIK